MSDELPPGWVRTTLGQLFELKYGKALPERMRKHGPYHVYGAAGKLGTHESAITSGPALVIGRKGTVGQISLSDDMCWPIDTTYYIDNFHGQPARFWAFYLSYINLAGLDTSTAIPGLNREDAYQIEVLLPPLAEQRRIVARIEALFDRIHRARANLRRAEVLTRRYFDRVCKAAFALDAPRKTIQDIATITSGFALPKELQGQDKVGYPFAKVRDISYAVLHCKARLFITENYVSSDDLASIGGRLIPPGSTVFAKVGEALHLNRRAITTRPLAIDNNCMAISPNTDIVDAGYLFRFFQTVDLSPLAVATSVPSVRRCDVAMIEIPVPSLDEQKAIARSLEAAQSFVETVQHDAARALALLDRLERAILARAFRGELVPQDPNDEPASVLLERIRREAPPPTRGRRRTRVRP